VSRGNKSTHTVLTGTETLKMPEIRTEEWTCIPAEGMELRFPEEVVTIFTDSVQPREDALVVDTFALDFKEGTLVK